MKLTAFAAVLMFGTPLFYCIIFALPLLDLYDMMKAILGA